MSLCCYRLRSKYNGVEASEFDQKVVPEAKFISFFFKASIPGLRSHILKAIARQSS